MHVLEHAAMHVCDCVSGQAGTCEVGGVSEHKIVLCTCTYVSVKL